MWYLRRGAGAIIIYFIVSKFWQMLGYQDFNAKSKKEIEERVRY